MFIQKLAYFNIFTKNKISTYTVFLTFRRLINVEKLWHSCKWQIYGFFIFAHKYIMPFISLSIKLIKNILFLDQYILATSWVYFFLAVSSLSTKQNCPGRRARTKLLGHGRQTTNSLYLMKMFYIIWWMILLYLSKRVIYRWIILLF